VNLRGLGFALVAGGLALAALLVWMLIFEGCA
jgi:hypothetical protein